MKDQGIDKGLVQKFDTSLKQSKGKYGFRKMFWDYLTKLGVTFVDKCCPDAGQVGMYPVRWNANLQQIEYFDGIDWNNITQISETTTTTTAATTTTTAAPTTTTTTAEVTTTTTGA